MDMCIFEFAERDMYYSICYITNSSSCLKKMALELDDDSICYMIQDQWYKKICLFKFAEKSGPLTYCPKIDEAELRDDCFFRYAWGWQNITMCNNIIGEEMKMKCNQDLYGRMPLSNYYSFW